MTPEPDIVEDRRSLEKFNFLKGSGDTQLRPVIRFRFGDLFPLEKNLSFLGMIEAIDTIQENRFSSAVGADDGEYLPLFDFQADIHQRLNSAEGHVKIFYFKLDLIGDGHLQPPFEDESPRCLND
jgi:hypothetical protein